GRNNQGRRREIKRHEKSHLTNTHQPLSATIKVSRCQRLKRHGTVDKTIGIYSPGARRSQCVSVFRSFFMGMRPNLLGCNSNKPSEGILMTQIIEQFLEVSSTYLLSPCDSDCCHKSAA